MVAPVVLPRPGTDGGHQLRADGPRRSGSSRSLPVPVVAIGRTGTAVYGLSAIDAHGRIADRAVMAALGWEPGRQLEVRAVRAMVTIRAVANGTAFVTSQGYLQLPAAVRHLCGLTPGDRVLLVADPEKQIVRVFPPATLDKLFTTEDAESAGGESR